MSLFQCAKIIKEAMEEKYGGMGFWQVRMEMGGRFDLYFLGGHWGELWN